MSKQVLILNITRMGDLVQMTPMLKRLEHEWPGVAIDLIIDKEFSEMAKLLPGIRHVWSYDFQALMDEARVRARDFVTLYGNVSTWAKHLVGLRYDRVINLTFNRRSAYLTGYVSANDIRGLTTAPDGSIIVKNPWMTYFLDMHTYRKLNRFNLVDVYALGGSGRGPFAPVELNQCTVDQEWAKNLLASSGTAPIWVCVQVGASDVMKAWRPHYFGQTMALMSKRMNVGFVLIGTKKEEPAVEEAVHAYKSAGGVGPLCHAVGKTTVAHLLGLLSQCQLMLTNDTGPMHLAVGVQVPIVNVSVGHVDFRETGPYGLNHWIVQPEIECGPCGFDQVCSHQSCKERFAPQLVADVCLHALGKGGLPEFSSGVRVYESGIDEDQLGTFHLRVGVEDSLQEWYGKFWRKFWYEDCTGTISQTSGPNESPPDLEQVKDVFEKLSVLLEVLCEAAQELVHLTAQPTWSIGRIKACHKRLNHHAHEARILGRMSPAFSPITSTCFRDTFNLSQPDLHGMACEHAKAYQTWDRRIIDVAQRMKIDELPTRRAVYARSIG